jgi:hypothetical protein
MTENENENDLTPEAKQALDGLADLGALLGIHDAETLADVGAFLRDTEPPLPAPEESHANK